MKHILCCLLCLLPAFLLGQSRQGLYGGISAGLSHYNTYWYYYRYDGNPAHDNYPSHSTTRPVLGLSLEKKGLVEAGPVQFDLGGDLLLGVGGKTKGEWLPGEETVSKSGWTLGLQGNFSAAFPLAGGAITPVIGLGPQIMMLHNNGKPSGDFASRSYYNYADGWNEFTFLLQATAGVDFKISSVVITPQLHVGVVGFSSSDWEPNEDGVDMNSIPGMFGFSIKVAKRF
ncbi:MAG TPA: hypothetical protein VGC22_10625 [Chitinophaga sp.]